MTIVYGYQNQTVGNPYWAERPPRNHSRSDLAELNLYDGGHGEQAITKNPVYVGLGVTVRMPLNQFTQTFQVLIEDIDIPASQIDITAQFVQIETTRVYELRGRAGFGPFNPGARPLADFDTTRTLKITVISTNVTISNKIEYLMHLGQEQDVRTCAEPRMDDFDLLQCLRENFIHLWADQISVPEALPPGVTQRSDLYVFFEQSDLLAQIVPCLCECVNWFALVTVGFKFFVVGDGEAADAALFPNQAGCNPWDEVTVPEIPGGGGDCVLPAGWPDSGCPD